jgi:hypothetical protein
MNFDIQRMIESKKALRRKLAGRPLAEKLEMLEILRDRSVALRGAAKDRRADVVHERETKYRTKKK